MLKYIELKGFKSFADRTKIEFDSGISCIVGPNGSGKSNITDAFRWVLGEKKQKNLRAGKMTDVIFGGTSKREALSLAEVSICFDNAQGYLPIEYSEVKITRKLYRSGESAYEINGNSCRVKDIRNLFADTGIGVEGYSIIGQGRIDKLLSSDKADRRLIFEEASGIAKLRLKKEEAERKLVKAEVNLERVDDIIAELEERVEPLRLQMEDAQKYNELNAKLKEIDINLHLAEIDVHSKKVNQYENHLTEIYDESEIKTNRLIKLKDDFSKEKIKSDELLSQKAEFFKKLSELEQTENKLSAEVQRDKDRVEIFEQNKVKLQAELKNVNHDVDDEIKDKLQLAIKALQEDYDTKKQRFEDEKIDIEKENKNLTEKYENLALSNADVRSKNEEISNLKINLTRLKAEMSSLDLAVSKAEDELAKAKAKEKEYTETLTDHLNLKNKCEKELTKKDSERLELEFELDKLRNDLSRIQNEIYDKNSELQSQKGVSESLRKRVDNHSVFVSASKDVLKFAKQKNDARVLGSIADLIETTSTYDMAIEQILGARIENIVCTDFDAAKEYIELLKSKQLGRATFMPLDNLKVKPKVEVDNVQGIRGHILDFISVADECEPAVRYLLYNVFVADDMDSAKLALDKLPLGCKIVTLSGEVINIGGSISGGHKKNIKTGILSDKRSLEESDKLIEKINSDINFLVEQKNSMKSIIEDNDILYNKKKVEIEEIIREVHKLEVKLDNYRSLIADEYTNIESKTNDIAESKEKRAEIENAISADTDKVGHLEIEINSLEEIIRQLKADVGKMDDYIKNRLVEHRDNENAMLELKYELENKNRELEDRLNLIKERIKRESSLNSELEKLVKDIEILKENIELNTANKAKFTDKIRVARLESNDSVELLNKSSSAMANLTEEIAELERVLNDLKNTIYEIKLKLTKSETKKEDAIKALWETYNMSLLEASEFKSDIDLKNPKRTRENLKEEIELLGEVNHLAIDEYAKVSERYEFLSTQRDDLLSGHKKLMDIVKTLNKDMSDKFTAGIKSINQNFSDSFKGLFRGGTASIELSDPENVLESEVIINAQPPGKKLQTLELLSGGEKALTAIAILFAILKDRPSPFCILDEIEAALDDNNIYLFSSYLKDFIGNSQFVVITHRKATMEASKALYGVTMKEKGISSVFSLSLDKLEV